MINILQSFPVGDKAVPLELGNISTPKDVVYSLKVTMFSGLLEGIFADSKLQAFFYRGRPIIIIYQTRDELEFGILAIERATEKQGQSKYTYTTSSIDSDILKCFCSLLSQYPVFRNFDPQILVIDELFNRMVFEKFNGCIYISTLQDHVSLYILDGCILDCDNGTVIDRYPINESPVIRDMAKAVTLMSDEKASIDIYEVSDSLSSDLASLEFGIHFKTPTGIQVLKDALSKIASEELKGKSIDFERALEEQTTELQDIQNFVLHLEKNLTIGLSTKTMQTLTERMTKAIADFKKC
jgi:hypothetical protein